MVVCNRIGAALRMGRIGVNAHRHAAGRRRLQDEEANTPQKMERLRSLTPHKLIARQKNGVPYYLYADPDDCKCLFIGDKIAFGE